MVNSIGSGDVVSNTNIMLEDLLGTNTGQVITRIR